MAIKLKRAYEEPADSDGMRLLVDRLWARGIRKDALHVDGWLKELAPLKRNNAVALKEYLEAHGAVRATGGRA